MRYTIAFLALLPLACRPVNRESLAKLTGRQWLALLALGVLFYSLTQGTMFLGLSLLPSVTVSLMLNFTPLIVAIMGIYLIREFPSRIQWFGILVFIVGISVYFYPAGFNSGELLGLMIMIIGVLVNAGSSVLGRSVNRSGEIPPLVVTLVSMGFGAILLLVVGIALNGIPHFSLKTGLLLLWMAIINTAFAFTLWNVTLHSLSAMQSSIINSTMLIQIGILAWVFLGESISAKGGIGMLIAATGAVMVQLKKNSSH